MLYELSDEQVGLLIRNINYGPPHPCNPDILQALEHPVTWHKEGRSIDEFDLAYDAGYGTGYDEGRRQ